MRRLSLLMALLIVCGAGSCRRAQPAGCAGCPVILISVDTLRADHLPMFGYRGVATPNLDALRRDSILFTSAYSAVPLTFPSHVAILTGRLPAHTNVRDNIGYRLDSAVVTLPMALKARGYDTGAAVSAYVLRGTLGLARSFDFYEDAISARADVATGSLQRSGTETAAIAKLWIDHRQTRPFFFFLHIFEPHAPYEPPEPFRSRYANAYDGEIAAADAIVGDFIAHLKRSGLYDRSVIVFLSDHGEGLGQHGEPEHGIFLYREVIHVPLMLKQPRNARGGESDDRVVSLVDVFPTVADLTAVPIPAGVDGRSLLQAADSTHMAYSETLYPRLHLGWSELRSLSGAEQHYIQAPRPELYRFREDPGEARNVADTDRRSAAAMRAVLARYDNTVSPPTPAGEEERRRLASLGYLTASNQNAEGPLPDPKDRIGEVAELSRAAGLTAQGRDAEAEVVLRSVLQKNPRLADAWDMLASSLERLGRPDQAAQAYRQAIVAAPELTDAFALRLGAILLQLQRFDEAAREAAISQTTNPGGAHLLLSRIAMAKNDLPAAIAEARQAQNDATTRVQARILEAQALARADRPREALAIVESILTPAQSLEFVRGDALARLGRDDEAVAAFEREIAAYPHQKQPYANLALISFLKGRKADGYAALERMTRANPPPASYLFAAQMLEQLGDSRGASEWRTRAAHFRPKRRQ